MAQLQKEGKVRWIGVSNFDVEELRRAQKIAPITSLQPPYSLVRREVEQELLPYCRSNEIGVIVYSPMASGLLTGAMTRERAASLPDSDWRSRDVEFKDPRLSRNLALVERLREVGERVQRPPGQVAIAWVLRNPAVTGAIVGARNATQVEGNVDAATLRLTNKEIAAQLGVTESAVKATLQQLFQKTGVRTRSQLVRIALERSLGTSRKL